MNWFNGLLMRHSAGIDMLLNGSFSHALLACKSCVRRHCVFHDAEVLQRQSRHPPLFPPTLVVSRFPSPPPIPSTSPSQLPPVPALSAVLSAILPLAHTLPLSLESLNRSKFAPSSKDEDLHAGVLQLPQGTVLLVSEGGVREGQLLEQGS